jgi:polyferredoxin
VRASIDIRNGLQNECIACAACIDVCDGVMDKMGSPRGHARASIAPAGADQCRRLEALCGAFAVSLASRSALLVDVIKDRNTLARVIDDGQVENVYRLQIMNRTESTLHLRVQCRGSARPGHHLGRRT